MEIVSERVSYEVTYVVTGVEPMEDWPPTAKLITPCRVSIGWDWSEGEPIRRDVAMWGYRTKKDGTRANMPETRIWLRNDPATWPEWLRTLADQRPALVPPAD